MSRFLLRIKHRLEMTVKDFRADIKYSFKYACYRMLDNLFSRMGLKIAAHYFHKKKIAYEIQYLETVLTEPIEKYKHAQIMGEQLKNAPVWVCWWEGIENAPLLVKQCVRSIERQAGSHPVYLITKDNYSTFLDVPLYLLKLMRNGKMGLAHFADYLRVCLLNKYGGLWLDATIYCAERIPEWYFELPLFTCKSEYRESNYLSHFQWATFCFGGWKANLFYAFLQDAFETYWKQNATAIDYLFFDDLIWIAREHIPTVRKMLDNVPMNTPHRDDLQAAFNACLPAEAFSSIICEDTPIYKLSWREKYNETTPDGQDSIYSYFLKLQI